MKMICRSNMKIPLYCKYCGKKLVSKVDIDSYDEYTGKPQYKKFVYCPNYLKIPPYGRHTDISFEVEDVTKITKLL